MSRVQLALNVADLRQAIGFYSKLFAVEPAKVRPGYANFVVDDPPLKLVLVEDPSQRSGSLNHLGVEVESAEAVGAARRRLAAEGLVTEVEDQVACCYAVQDKVWVAGPGGDRWEVYTVLTEAEMPAGRLRSTELGTSGCCTTRREPVGATEPAPSACC